jgi:hypothetical protein
MSGILVAVALLLVIAVAFIMGKFKKAKPIIEMQANGEQIKRLDLKPGEYVKLITEPSRKEVEVYTTRRNPQAEKIGTINNGFIYRNVTKNKIEAKINAVNESSIMLEVVRL